MERDIQYGPYYLVETNNGTTLVPFDVMSGRVHSVRNFAQFVEGKPTSFKLCTGFYGRYSMPGYLDCTDWLWADSEAELIEKLGKAYGRPEEDDGSELPTYEE